MKLPQFRYQILITFALVLISYGGSIWNEYSLDDELVTTPENKKVSKGLSGIKDIFTKPYEEKDLETSAYGYRPITQVSFAIEKQLFGFNPGLSHLINIIIYMFVILVIFQLLLRLFPKEPSYLLFFIILIFAIHPIHSEVVLSLKNREELLVSLFGFLAFLTMVKAAQQDRLKFGFYCSVLLLSVGALTKATITPFVILIPVSLFFFNLTTLKKSTLLFLGYFTVTFLTINILRTVLDISTSRNIDFIENPLYYSDFWNRLPMFFYSLYKYISLQVVPAPLLSYYGYNEIPLLPWLNIKVITGILCSITILVLLLFNYKKNRLLSFGLLSLSIFVFPFLNFPVPATGIIAERFTFNAVLGFSIVMVVMLHRISNLVKLRYFTMVLLVPILAMYTYVNIERTPQWKTKLSLIENDAAIGQNSYKLQSMLGDLYQEQIGLTNNLERKKYFFQKTLRAYEKASKIYDKEAGLYNNIGTTFIAAGDYKNAIILLQKAIEIDSNTVLYRFHLAIAYEQNNDIEKAKELYTEILAKKPHHQQAKTRLQLLEKK